MPRTAEDEPTPFSRAVTQGIADAIAEAGMSQAAVARKAGLSANYLNERMRGVKSFTISDIDNIARALRFNPSRFLLDAEATSANVGRDGDTSGIDSLSVLTGSEVQAEDLTLAADDRADTRPDPDQATQEEPDDDDDARPGA